MLDTDFTPDQLIDTTDNKPIEEQEPQQNEQTKQTVKQISAKKIKDLTNEERLTIITNAHNGIENEFYKVQFNKNGTTRITQRKKPIDSTSETIIKQRSPSLTTEQLLMEHVIGLESQLATLRQKHKNLKRNYKNMYQDMYIDDDDINATKINGDNQQSCLASRDNQSNNNNNIPINNALPPNNPNNGNIQDLAPSPSQSQQQNISYLPQIKRTGWRARIPIY